MNSTQAWTETREEPRIGAQQGGNTLGKVGYLVRGKERAVSLVPPEESGDARQRLAEYEEHTISVENLRPFAADLSLDGDGVILRARPTAAADLYDETTIAQTYYPEIEALLKAETGAKRIVTFDHTRRVEGDGSLEAKWSRRPVRTVHNDYTDKSGPQRVRDLLGAEADGLLAGRFAVINTWRPIRGPVLRAPLGFIHPESLAPEDVLPADLIYEDRVGEIYEVAYNPGHRWLYVPEMTREEILIFKCFDSARDGRARFLPHTGFDDFATPELARTRESIETRSLVFF